MTLQKTPVDRRSFLRSTALAGGGLMMDDSSTRTMPGTKDVFSVKVLNDDQVRENFDTITFNEVVAIVGRSTWKVMKAKNKLKIADDALVLVGWNPGEGRSLPPMTHAEFKQAWTICINNGAYAPKP